MAQQPDDIFQRWLSRPISPEEVQSDARGAIFSLSAFKINALRAGIEAKQSEAASVLGIPQSVIDAYLNDEITIFEFFERLRETHDEQNS